MLLLDNAAGWILELDRGHGVATGQLFHLAGSEEKRLQVEQRQGRLVESD